MAKMFNTLKKSMFKSSKKEEDVEVDLFSPLKISGIGQVKNRMVLAPMTRARATQDGRVGKHHVEYYKQRAEAGSLVITEGVHISPQAIGWWCAPNIFTDEQAKAWKPVTDAVHSVGGLIVLQLWHTGRASHSDYMPEKSLPVAPSAIAISNGEKVHVPGTWGEKDCEVPHALTIEEIQTTIKDYVAAAKKALSKSAGFDGVEVHGANGYLIDEFIQSCSNNRTDKYGGSVENRVRIVDEVLSALKKEVPANKIGIRFSPNGVFHDMGSADNIETFTKAIEIAAKHKIAYIHLMDGLGFGFHNKCPQFTLSMAKEIIAKVQGGEAKRVTKLFGNVGYNKETATAVVKAKEADAITFGRPWIANPDLVERYKNDSPLTEVEGMAHYYTPNAEDPSKGYSDFTKYDAK